MKLFRLLTAGVIAAALSTAAFAADPTGTWTFSVGNPTNSDAPRRETTLVLKYADNQLTGTLAGMMGGRGGSGGADRPDRPARAEGERPARPEGAEGADRPNRGMRRAPVEISDASFKDDVVTFSVVRTGRDDMKFVTKYSGKLEGDTITGKITFSGREGQERSIDWVAKRATGETPAEPAPAS